MRRMKKVLAVSLLTAGIVVGAGVAPASATTINASSFAHELCGDAAFSDESDGVHVVIHFDDGYGPFGGGSYDCATGDVTV